MKDLLEPASTSMNNTNRSSLRICIALAAFVIGYSAAPAFALFFRGGTLGVGTRAMGLSGSFTAVADDPSAAYWNPAGLAQLTQPQLTGMLGSYFNDKNRNLYFSFHYPLPPDIHLAISTNNLFYTDIAGAREDQYTASVAIPLLKGGDPTAGSKTESLLEKKTVADQTRYGIASQLYFGANFRFLLADIGMGGGIVQGRGVDLGLLYRHPFKDNTEIKGALVLTDISTSVRFDNTGVEQFVPAILTAGLAYCFDPYTLVTVDVPWTLSNDVLLNGQNVRIRTGVEHWFFDGRLGLRAGYSSFLTLPGEFSLGASYRMKDWSVDYAFMNHSDSLGNSHRLSAGYVFNSTANGEPDPKPYMVQSLVGDEKIYLKWDIPEGSKADGYLVYVRSDEDKDFRRAKQELLQTKYCLLRGAKNGVRYHLFIRSVVGGKERFACSEWVTTPQPMAENARKYYEQGLKNFNENKMSASLYSTRKAEEFDPNNYDIKNLLRKLETTHHEGLVPEEDK